MVRHFVRFLYTDALENPKETLAKHKEHLGALSHMYDVKLLHSICINEIEQTEMTHENVLVLLKYSRLYDIKSIASKAFVYLNQNKALLKTEEWKATVREDPTMLTALLESMTVMSAEQLAASGANNPSGAERSAKMQHKTLVVSLERLDPGNL